MRDLPYWSKLELGPDGRRKACTQRFNVGSAKNKATLSSGLLHFLWWRMALHHRRARMPSGSH
jgi:hypothetical protein